jgi:hypothetical protein
MPQFCTSPDIDDSFNVSVLFETAQEAVSWYIELFPEENHVYVGKAIEKTVGDLVTQYRVGELVDGLIEDVYEGLGEVLWVLHETVVSLCPSHSVGLRIFP